MSEEKLYTFDEVLERLMLTDEELLLCQQHKEYSKRLDEILEFDSERMDIIGQNGNDGLHYDSIGNIGDPPDEPREIKWKNRRRGKYEYQEYE
jgi:hypothetical protein